MAIRQQTVVVKRAAFQVGPTVDKRNTVGADIVASLRAGICALNVVNRRQRCRLPFLGKDGFGKVVKHAARAIDVVSNGWARGDGRSGGKGGGGWS